MSKRKCKCKHGEVYVILSWAPTYEAAPEPTPDTGRPVVVVDTRSTMAGQWMADVAPIDGAGELKETAYFEYELDGPIAPEVARLVYGWSPQ